MKAWRVLPIALFTVSCVSTDSHRSSKVTSGKHFVVESPVYKPYPVTNEQQVAAASVPASERVPANTETNYIAEIEAARGSTINRLGGDNSVAAAAGRMEKIFEYARTQPVQFFSFMRRNRPIFVSQPAAGWTIKGDKSLPPIVLVTRHADVKNVLDHNTVFTVKTYKEIMDATVGSAYMLGRDGDEVNEEKPHVRPNVDNAQDAARVRAIVASLAKRAIEQGAENGEIDIVKHVTRAVPIGLNEEYFGFNGPSPDHLLKWSRATQHAFFHNPFRDARVSARSVEAGKEMRQHIRQTLIPGRKRELANGRPDNDIVSQILKLSETHSRFGITDERIVANVIGLLVGSVETTSAAIAQSLQFILKNPRIYQEAVRAAERGDDALLSAIVWEALRYDPVNPWLARYTEEDFVLGAGTSYETVVKKGSLVLAATESAMFDETVFPSPNSFRTDRDPSSYMHLGYGYHRCLGDDVSLIMVPETIKHILLMKNVRIKPGRRGPGVIDQDGGPFPESFVLQYDEAAKDQSVRVPLIDTKTAMGYLTLGEFVVDRITNMERRREALQAIRAIVTDDGAKKAKAINVLPELIVDATKDLSHDQRTAACMEKNPRSVQAFPNATDRKNYCEVRMDFRGCYFTQRLFNKQSSYTSYYHCAYDRQFLTPAERTDLQIKMGHLDMFYFLNLENR